MTQIELIDKIKAEIERLEETECSFATREQRAGFYDALDMIQDFIESLEVVIDEGKEEIDNAFTNMMLKESSPKIRGWVSRDSVEDVFNGCGLILHHTKPRRIGGEWSNHTIVMHLPWSMFPDLKWEDDPIEVELTINKVK